MSGESGLDFVQSYSFTHVAPNRRLCQTDSHLGERVSLASAMGGPMVDRLEGTVWHKNNKLCKLHD